MAVGLVYNACDIIVSAMIQSLLSKRPTCPLATACCALAFAALCRAVPSGIQLMAARALAAAVLTAVFAKPSRVEASAIVGPFIEESVKYALTALRSPVDGLAVHVAPCGNPA
jgi:hypothetical protein